ncbi:MAG TPA: NADH-quinone oxidoreductase subunit L [Caulobacteraceae bacterium]|jgi:NADH-quinone oxidoreductase subunit L|nr:NADH-quinone oxidoreductase subunit L [Caulobacteraceae bacterium]
MSPAFIVTTIVLAPLLGAIIAGLFGRRIGDTPSRAVTTGLLLLAMLLSWGAFYEVIWGQWGRFTVHLAPFINVGTFRSDWSVRIDSLSAVMLVVVTTVSGLVHVYSWGYMADDDSKPRFFAYLSLFTFAMLALVTAADFMQLFFGWEGVGLASYLLIGFWYQRPAPPPAAIKAFIVNRVGDFGFALGIMTTYWMFGTLRFAEIFPAVSAHAHQTWMFAGQAWNGVDLACTLLFVGAMGKSAQFFLHTWLPDAMEGPTPVSALIHAATMVTAGVYMVCLLSPMFEYAPVAKQIVTVIGAVTALFAATVGLAQNDIKRVIAYSTCSQLGYMFFAAGVGAYQGAMFHLFTHAFFKALLFLCAGSVILGVHHEQDMRKMGGLWRYLPWTYAFMLVGTIAITGMGIPGLELGFAGFYSKDAIINAAYADRLNSGTAYFAFIVGLLAAGLTAFYSWRLIFMTFHGTPKWAHDEAHVEAHVQAGGAVEHHEEPAHGAHGHDAHAYGHDDHGHGGVPHESPWSMRLPLLLLSIGAIFAGGLFSEQFIGDGRAAFWKGAILNLPSNKVLDQLHSTPMLISLAPLILSLIGLAIAYYVYVVREGLGLEIAERRGPLWILFYNKWFFDEIYDATFVRGAKALGDFFWKVGDQTIIDGGGPNGFAAISAFIGRRVGRWQTGYVYHYAFVMLLGVAGLLSFALYSWSR